jgi:hypothetical protein
VPDGHEIVACLRRVLDARWLHRIGAVETLASLVGVGSFVYGVLRKVGVVGSADTLSLLSIVIGVAAIAVGVVLYRQRRVRAVSVQAERIKRDALREWLQEPIMEVRGLQDDLRGALAGPVPNVPRATSVLTDFWRMNSDVLRRLRMDAPEWVPYFLKTPQWWDGNLVRATHEQFMEVDRLLDCTVGQLEEIRQRLY